MFKNQKTKTYSNPLNFKASRCSSPGTTSSELQHLPLWNFFVYFDQTPIHQFHSRYYLFLIALSEFPQKLDLKAEVLLLFGYRWNYYSICTIFNGFEKSFSASPITCSSLKRVAHPTHFILVFPPGGTFPHWTWGISQWERSRRRESLWVSGFYMVSRPKLRDVLPTLTRTSPNSLSFPTTVCIFFVFFSEFLLWWSWNLWAGRGGVCFGVLNS